MFENNAKKLLAGLSITTLVCIALGFMTNSTASSNANFEKELFEFLTHMPEKQMQIHPDDLPKQPEKHYLIIDVRYIDGDLNGWKATNTKVSALQNNISNTAEVTTSKRIEAPFSKNSVPSKPSTPVIQIVRN